jgi:hypothetical protein
MCQLLCSLTVLPYTGLLAVLGKESHGKTTNKMAEKRHQQARHNVCYYAYMPVGEGPRPVYWGALATSQRPNGKFGRLGLRQEVRGAAAQ